MRASPVYTKLLQRYARRDPALELRGGSRRGIGWLGDQTLFSWMSIGDEGRHLFHRLPCGFNLQIHTHEVATQYHCNSCSVLHGNGALAKLVIARLGSDRAKGVQCHQTMAAYLRAPSDKMAANEIMFRRGTSAGRMLDRAAHACCNASKPPGVGV